MAKEVYSRNTFLLFFLILGILAFLLMKPFLSAILAGVVIAYIFFPVHYAMHRYVKGRTWCALISSILIILIVSIPFFIFVTTVSKEATESFVSVRERLSDGKLLTTECSSGLMCSLNKRVMSLFADPNVRMYVQEGLTNVANKFLDSTSKVLVSLPKIILDLFIMLFVMFYTFRDGKKMVKRFFHIVPLRRQFKEDLFNQTKHVLYATVYGTLVIALIQGIIASIGFIIFGVSSPILLGMLVAVIALIPLIGPAFVWVPVSGYIILQGYFGANSVLLGKGIGLFVYSAIFISATDNFLKPKFIGAKSQMHPAVVLIGILGGLALLGIIGILVGPVIMALFVSFIRVFEQDKKALLRT